MKRFSFIFISLILCCCFVFGCISVSAEDIEVDGYTVVDYMDYITGYDLFLAGDGWAYLNFGNDLFTSYKEDANGWESSVKGSRLWNLAVDNNQRDFSAYVTSQIPGGGINDTFLALNNIPSGSKFHFQCVVNVDDYVGQQCELLITIFNGIKYYDENFEYISGFHPKEHNYTLDLMHYGDDTFSQVVEIDINKPDNAAYAVLYSRVEFGIGQSNVMADYVNISAQFINPHLKISTSYTQIIVQSIVQAKPPAEYGTIIDLGELEAILSGQTQQGQQSADQLFQTGPEVIGGFLSGFTFMSVVFSSLTSHNWFYSLLTVSLALGLFNYIVNGVMSAGRSLEHKGGKGGGKK